MMKKFALILSVCCFLAACGETHEPTDDPTNEPASTVTKQEAASLNGKSDHGIDFCDYFGWYGDGVCDGFCPQPDPDCQPSSVSCGARAGDTCANSEFCDYQPGEYCGAADAQSSCAPRPQYCYTNYDPVCGCDGVTYQNECFANGYGTGVNYLGTCAVACSNDSDCGSDEVCNGGTCETAPEPVDCGARAGDTCTNDQYCAYQAGQYCGAADAQSFCETRPTICHEIYAPVCGCDGQTYENDCAANAAGSGILHEGACVVTCNSNADCSNGEVCNNNVCEQAPQNVSCGARAGDTCTATQFCAYTEGQSCGWADAQSVCQTKPDICPQDASLVCGCDGNTYNNACLANAAGTGVLQAGACEPEPVICGGFFGQACGADEYCAYQAGQYCGQADASSTCETRPEVCTALYDPVCGCNGVTYSNGCNAAAAGTGIYGEGPC